MVYFQNPISEINKNTGFGHCGSFVTFKPTFLLAAPGDVDLAALAGVHGAVFCVTAAFLPGLASSAVREHASCQIQI